MNDTLTLDELRDNMTEDQFAWFIRDVGELMKAAQHAVNGAFNGMSHLEAALEVCEGDLQEALL